jgi:drug/metabolite transporter (DMT)-like permease
VGAWPSSSPIISAEGAVLLASLVLRERPSRRQLTGLVVAGVGVVGLALTH